jgi:cell division protein ZapE
MPFQPADSHALDPEQRELVAHLDHLAARLLSGDEPRGSGDEPRGVYLYGAVGRGKTWLCDQFFDQLPTPAKRRVHFHSFFRSLHRDIWNHRVQNPSAAEHAVGRAVASLLDGVDVLFFDEFHVHDSGDAALVLRVLDSVLASGVTLLATSNFAPRELLPGPFHHVFERGIRLIEQNLDVVQLGGDRDYRRGGPRPRRAGFAAGSWVTPGTPDQLSAAGLSTPTAAEARRLQASGHQFAARRAANRQAWFSFAELCERDTAVTDYLGWAADYDVWVVDGVPRLADASPQAAQRFANLIDVLCDRDATLHVLSEHSRGTVVEASRLPLNGDRAASRLALLQNVETIHTSR